MYLCAVETSSKSRADEAKRVDFSAFSTEEGEGEMEGGKSGSKLSLGEGGLSREKFGEEVKAAVAAALGALAEEPAAFFLGTSGRSKLSLGADGKSAPPLEGLWVIPLGLPLSCFEKL